MRRTARLLTLLGPLLVVVGLSKVHAAAIAEPEYDYTGSFRLAWSLVYAALLAVAAYGSGLPDLPRRLGRAAWLALGAAGAAALGVSAVQLVLGDALLPRFVVFGAALLTVPVQVLATALSRQGRSMGEERDRVLLVGPPDAGELLARDLAMAPERPAVLVATIGPADAIGDGALRKPLVDLALAQRSSVVVLDRSALGEADVISQAAALHEAGVRVRSLLQFYEEWLAKLPVSELERASLFFDISELHKVRYGRLKRMIDVACGLAGLVPLALLTPVVAVGNLFANRGPLLYRQERVGRGGAPFSILKFRTMRPTDPSVTATWTATDDHRVTPLGKVLRASHLDELPQVVNILRGELSVVGPRPEQQHYVVELSSSLPFYNLRHLVRPGLTGWAQVKYGYAGDERDALEKLQYEFFYLRHQSLRFDARVLARTIRSVVGSEGGGR